MIGRGRLNPSMNMACRLSSFAFGAVLFPPGAGVGDVAASVTGFRSFLSANQPFFFPFSGGVAEGFSSALAGRLDSGAVVLCSSAWFCFERLERDHFRRGFLAVVSDCGVGSGAAGLVEAEAFRFCHAFRGRDSASLPVSNSVLRRLRKLWTVGRLLPSFAPWTRFSSIIGFFAVPLPDQNATQNLTLDCLGIGYSLDFR